MLTKQKKVEVTGPVGEVQIFNGEKCPAVKFALGTTKIYLDCNGKQHMKTTWHNVTTYQGVMTTIFQFTNSGDCICINGTLRRVRHVTNDGLVKYKKENRPYEIRVIESPGIKEY